MRKKNCMGIHNTTITKTWKENEERLFETEAEVSTIDGCMLKRQRFCNWKLELQNG